MENLAGKVVEVRTIETVYRGILVEIGEADVHLKSETGWIIIPLARIVDISAAN